MAISSSIGYPGTVDAVQWASLTEELGAAYSVVSKDDWKVTVVTGPDRTVSVASGTGFGRGVMDVNSAPVNLQHASVSSGTRYDLVCAHRNWSTPATTFTIVQGTSAAVIPAARAVSPGALDDQPLALVRITSGSTIPVIEADLRTWPSKIITVNDLRALVDPRLGDEAVLSTTKVRYRRILDVGGNPIWAVSSDVFSGTERACIGTSPPAGTKRIYCATSAVVSTSGAGGCAVAIPTPFQNGIISYGVEPGDFNYNLVYLTTLLGNCSLGAWNGIAFAEGGGRIANASAIRININAVGW